MTETTLSILRLQFFAGIARQTEWSVRNLIDYFIADQVPENFVQQVRLIHERLIEIRINTGPYRPEELQGLSEQTNIVRLSAGFSQFKVVVKDLVVLVDNLISSFTLTHLQDVQYWLGMVTGLLDNAIDQFVRFEQRKITLALETFDVVTVIREVIELVERRFFTETTNNKLIVSCTDTLGTIHTDRVRLRQVLLNPLVRAAESTQNGTIMLCATREKTDNGDWLIFQVDDTGQGIPADQLQNLEQSIAHGTYDIPTTHLGLFIMARLCQITGGEFTITSEWGKGSHVWMRIPAIFNQPQDINERGEAFNE